MFPPDVTAARRTSSVALDTYRKSFALIPRSLADHIVYTCETDRLAQAYERLLGTLPITLPLPSGVAAALPRQADPTEMRISFLGCGRAEKGFHLLPEVISQVHRQRPNVQFVVQVVAPDKHNWDRVIHQLSQLESRLGEVVHLDHKPIIDDDWSAAICRSSLLLLP